MSKKIVKFLGGNFFNGPCFFNGLEVSFCFFCCIYVSVFFNKLNKEISLSSRSLLASRNSFSLKTSKFGEHSLFSSGKNERFDHFFIVHLVSLMPDVTFVENLSNRSSGLQIPWDICTRFGCYLYSTECSWIINRCTLITWKRRKNITHATHLRFVAYFFVLTTFWRHPCVIRVHKHGQMESTTHVFVIIRNS